MDVKFKHYISIPASLISIGYFAYKLSVADNLYSNSFFLVSNLIGLLFCILVLVIDSIQFIRKRQINGGIYSPPISVLVVMLVIYTNLDYNLLLKKYDFTGKDCILNQKNLIAFFGVTIIFGIMFVFEFLQWSKLIKPIEEHKKERTFLIVLCIVVLLIIFTLIINLSLTA